LYHLLSYWESAKGPPPTNVGLDVVKRVDLF
jgi:hypothetical protein